MGIYKPIKLTVDGYKITMSDSIDLYVGDRVTLQFELYKLAIATRFGTAAKTTDIQPLTAILYIETPDGRDVMEAADIIDNLVEFNLSEEYTQNIGVSRLQLRLFDDNGDRITLPEFTFNVKESIYGDQVTKINLSLADENRNAVVDEKGNRIATPTQALNVAVNKQIQSFSEKISPDGNEDILIQDSGITKRIKIDSLLAQTNTQLSRFEINKMDKGGEIVVSQINKNKGKLDQTYMTDEFLQQMAGETPINSIPADKSITLEKLTFQPITGEQINLANPLKFEFDKHLLSDGRIANVTAEYVNTRFVTEYISIFKNIKYYISGAHQICLYDNDKNHVKNFANSIATTSENVRFISEIDGYIRICAPNQRLLLMCKTDNDLGEEEYFDYNEFALKNASIRDRSVLAKKIKEPVLLGEKNYNLLDLTKTAFNHYVDWNNGEMMICADNYVNKIFVTDFIEVESDERYTLKLNALNIVFYDIEKNFISSKNNLADCIVTTPLNTKYIRLSLWCDELQSNYYLYQGDEQKPFIDYNQTVLSKESVGAENLKPLSVNKNHLDESIYLFNPDYVSPNLFNPEVATRGKFVMGWDSGGISDPTDGSTGYNASDYIEVEAGESYSLTKIYRSWSAVYDKYKQFICGFEDIVINGITAVMPDNAKYIRITVKDPEFDEFMVVKGNVLPNEFVEYGERLITRNQLHPSVFSVSEIRHCLPKIIHAVEGETAEIFFDSILGVHNIDQYKVMLNGFKCVAESNQRKMVITNPTINDNSAGSILVYDNQNNLVKTIDVEVRVHPVKNPDVTKNVLIIGDSLTGQNATTVTEIYNKFQTYNLTNLKLIGTRDWGEGKYHEGRGGWKISDYMTGKEDNPFWDPSLGKPNFKKYCEKNGYSGIDYCYIHMNWNDQFKNPQHMYNQYKSLMECISQDYPECQIIAVSLTSYSAKDVSQIGRWCECDKFVAFDLADIYEKLHLENANWHSINSLSQIDVEYANLYTSEKANIRSGEMVKKLKDHVHFDTVGYLQIADAYFRFLMYLLNK